MYCQKRSSVGKEGVAFLGGLQIDGQQRRLPVIGMDNIGPKIERFQSAQDGAGEENEPDIIILVVLAGHRIDIESLAVKQAGTIDKIDPRRATRFFDGE